MNQDFIGWVGQGRIADRTREHLGASDSGIVMIRKRLLADLEAVARGHDPKGILRDPSRNVRIELPSVRRKLVKEGLTTAEILANPTHRQAMLSYTLQAGQPEWVRQQFVQAMGMEAQDYRGPVPGRAFMDAPPVGGRGAGR